MPFDLVIFGAGGDLGRKKIFPALAKLAEGGWLGDDYRILATSRGQLDKATLFEHIQIKAETKKIFEEKITIVNYASDPAALKSVLAKEPRGHRAFYAATPPEMYVWLATSLASAGLITESSLLVLEKPIGSSLSSYREITEQVSENFPERLIYRIDHYLGKETVQNLLCLRFANLILEPLWNRSHIDHVQITVAESTGIAGRAAYYDKAGALRDMIQNHLMQLLCLIAMEPPCSYDADFVRDEKIKVLRSLRTLDPDDVVCGQYRGGLVDDSKVPSYRVDVAAESTTETYSALRVNIDNWRWSGVPFYLRTGKRMPIRDSRIVIRFKSVPHAIFAAAGRERHNQIVVRLQPDEGVELLMHSKIPGPGRLRLKPTVLNLNYLDSFGAKTMPDAYERLLLDALRSNPTLFMRDDEVEASWRWLEPVLGAGHPKVEFYNAGTWGPDSAEHLIGASGRRWDNPEIPFS